MVFAFFLDFIWLFVKEFLYLHINSTRIRVNLNTE